MRISAIAMFIGAVASVGLMGGCEATNFPGQGITNDYGNYVPDAAKSVGTGTGSVSFRAASNGTAYVIDWNTFNREAKDKYAPKVIKTAMVLTGQTITVDAATQTITIGAIGNTTATVFTDKNLSPEHTYEIRLDTTKHWF
ncbi:MAG: hypothetical protein ACTHLZ_17905 [Tepidisphaeraceae bacterium]